MAFSFFLKSQRRATLCQRLEEAVAAEMARGSSQSQTKLGELEKMMEKRITALSFENMKDDSGHNPIVRSMSEIAGSAVMLIAGQYLSSFNNGKGVLLGGISGIPPTKVIIIGAGIVGEYAARTALAVGGSVKIFDNNIFTCPNPQATPASLGTRCFSPSSFWRLASF